jgi:hypothetical protein
MEGFGIARKRYLDEDCLKILRRVELDLAGGVDVAKACTLKRNSAMAHDIKNTGQSSSAIINVIAQAQRTGRELTVDDNGKIGVASFGTHIAIKWNTLLNGNGWKTQRDAQVNKDVLDHLTVAIEKEIHSGRADQKELKARNAINSQLTQEFSAELKNGTLPSADRLKQILHEGSAKELNVSTKENDEAAERLCEEWTTGNISYNIRHALNQVASGYVNGYAYLGELNAAHHTLFNKVDALRAAYERNPSPSEEESEMLAKYETALAKFTLAIEDANTAYRTTDAAHKGYTPQHSTVAVVEPSVDAEFIGKTEDDASAKATPK